ncbi:hypothetical protein VIGAN_03057200 [Vigna angularis var. angularis]|uniref:Uncharacterized protein n=1 Tax=Vigna angularis var. angularis TaxID=157739 RepID=A0A0S3RKA1_PHAAN|nr:hypothetical protein VIGAN_03057200 [Vigna angularis var. angularis]
MLACMEWCSHCCRVCPTRLEPIYGDISVDSCSVCNLCGKVLLDLDASLHVIFPDKNADKSSKIGNDKNVQPQKQET